MADRFIELHTPDGLSFVVNVNAIIRFADTGADQGHADVWEIDGDVTQVRESVAQIWALINGEQDDGTVKQAQDEQAEVYERLATLEERVDGDTMAVGRLDRQNDELRFDLTRLAQEVDGLLTAAQITAMFTGVAEKLGAMEARLDNALQGTTDRQRRLAAVEKLLDSHIKAHDDVTSEARRAHARLDGLTPQLATSERVLLDKIEDLEGNRAWLCSEVTRLQKWAEEGEQRVQHGR